MDRVQIFPGELPRSVDILLMNKNVLYALGFLSQAVIGNGPSIAGLTLAPTSPASLQVTVGAGSIYAQAVVDATAYAGLGTDSNSVVKQGLLMSPATLTLTPPVTAGYSQVFLVQVIYADTDSGATVLPYYNSANPAVPYAGPANSGASQFTQRNGVCVVGLKAGIAAPTGTQTIPSPDAGYTGIYAITVANGQTSVTSANWITLPGAPFIPTVTSAQNAIPSGMLAPFAGSTAPTGWLLCYGQAVSRTTYATLFGVIGTSYGVGDGSTTFNVPDMRGRVIAGADNMGGSAASRLTSASITSGANTLGNSGGEETHHLLKAELPAYNLTVTDPGHVHSVAQATGGSAGSAYSLFGANVAAATQNTGSATTGISVASGGSDTSHNNVQPTLIGNYIIRI
jgi:microcystin-dependent protein